MVMTDPKDIAKADVNKALAWLKINWYQFLIGALAGVLLGHIFWK
jgi:hypothetical protein